VIGARSTDQLQDSVAAVRMPGFTPDELARIDALVAGADPGA
jgi:aryl-alcohol dehydrogenase-like predicted oxidoreductase